MSVIDSYVYPNVWTTVFVTAKVINLICVCKSDYINIIYFKSYVNWVTQHTLQVTLYNNKKYKLCALRYFIIHCNTINIPSKCQQAFRDLNKGDYTLV